MVPATVEDAWGLMNTAIDDGDPVLFLEQKYFYRRLKGALPPRDHRTPLGKARVVREGSDITVVTWGLGVERCTEAADRLGDSADIEIIDLRSIVPWDQETIAASVRKTSRLIIVHEARRTCGFGAEIAAWASEELFEWLDAPVLRLTAEDVPSPSNKALERQVTPQVDDIEAGIDRTISW